MEDPLRERLKQQRQSWIELREVATPSASLPSRKQLSVPSLSVTIASLRFGRGSA